MPTFVCSQYVWRGIFPAIAPQQQPDHNRIVRPILRSWLPQYQNYQLHPLALMLIQTTNPMMQKTNYPTEKSRLEARTVIQFRPNICDAINHERNMSISL